MNKAPILWYSKQQNTVGTTTFLSKFIALKTATELVESLLYKLKIFGIPTEGPSSMFCENESFSNKVSTPEFKLKGNNVSICYHKCRETVATGVYQIAKEGTATNLANLFTKILVHIRRETLFDKFTY